MNGDQFALSDRAVRQQKQDLYVLEFIFAHQPGGRSIVCVIDEAGNIVKGRQKEREGETDRETPAATL